MASDTRGPPSIDNTQSLTRVKAGSAAMTASKPTKLDTESKEIIGTAGRGTSDRRGNSFTLDTWHRGWLRGGTAPMPLKDGRADFSSGCRAISLYLIFIEPKREMNVLQCSNPTLLPIGRYGPSPEQRRRRMRSIRSVYRGFAIYVSGRNSTWSFRAEPITADLPILTRSMFEGHPSRGAAWRTAKREIDRLLLG
jgi:hypothetical protein